jgi:hypothetical protein
MLAYIRAVSAFDKTFVAIEKFLRSPDAIYDYQVYQIIAWINDIGLKPSDNIIGVARELTFDLSRPSYLRAAARNILRRYGTIADLDRLLMSYAETDGELEKAEILVGLERLEAERRDSFYLRVGSDGELCERAVRLIRK